MKNQILNRDIKRLYKADQANRGQDVWEEQEGLKKEFLRLYHADNTGDRLTLDNLKRMMILNRKRRWVAFHRFYIFMNEEI